jgi:subtilisin family serine protease
MRRVFLLLAAGAVLAEPLRAQEGKMDGRLFEATAPGARASFLVVLAEQADLSAAPTIAERAERRRFVFETLTEVARRTQAPLLEKLRAAGVAVRSHYLANFLEVEGDRSMAAELARRPDVSRIAANRPSRLERLPERESSGALGAEPSAVSAPAAPGANLDRIGATALWARGIRGQGIVVGDADTGFAWEHPALKPRYRGFDGATASHAYNWRDAVHDAGVGNPCGSDSPVPCDDSGHGTSTSGLAVGDDGAGNAIGVAPGARLIGCRNMDRGVGTPARYTECFEFLLAPTDASGDNPRPDLGADVINNSWGCPASEGCTDPQILRSVVESVRAAGVAVVVSAGNGGAACGTISDAPAIYEASLSIGATTNTDVIASFSSRGPVTVDGSNRLKPDVVAPGFNVRTAALPDTYTPFFTGTSASAPHVAGAVALLWSGVASLRGDVARTEEILRGSAAPLTSGETCAPFPGDVVPNAVFGFGRIDCVAALALAEPPAPRVVRPLPEHRPPARPLEPRNP